MSKSRPTSSQARSKTATSGSGGKRQSLPLGTIVLVLGIIASAIILYAQARALWFTQDDAYISYRYAQNALSGDGLVFNAGERVEGYTNFLWVLLLIVGGRAGIGFDSLAKALGLLSAFGLIALTGIWVRAAWRELRWGDGGAPGAAAALAVGCNGSVAYWSVSGLETVWFAFFVSLALWWWVRRSRLVIPALAIATLSRPEGALVWAVLVAAEWLWGEGPRRSLLLAGAAVVLLAPFAVFKILYYGSLLPNPFYAKTGFAWEYIASGLDYTWLYLQQYGLYGLAGALVLLAVIPLRGRWRAVPAVWLIYTLYITMVGGDVLKAHRFFVPMTIPLILGTTVALGYMVRRLSSGKMQEILVPAFVAGFAVVTFVLPKASLEQIRAMEVGLENKMSIVTQKLRSTDYSNFSVAASTIGRISYDLMGHRVIDMLGLTDSMIARHPEVIPGNVSTWRERNFNATYVLQQDPDYILFSTGHKPSAPAERALMLHEKFRRNYYAAIYPSTELQRNLAVHKRKGPYTGTDKVWPSIQLAHDINQAWNYSLQDMPDSARALMSRIKREGPGDFCVPDHFLADQWYREGKYNVAMAYADSAIATDSFSVVAWQLKGSMYQLLGDTLGLRGAVNHMSRIAPWLVSM
jgi:hypothetical protein